MGGSRRKFGASRRKKRSFGNNQYSKNAKKAKSNTGAAETQEQEVHATASGSKLAGKSPVADEIDDGSIQGNRIMDMSILSSVFELLPCPKCGKVMLDLCELKRDGMASHMKLECVCCGWSHDFINTKKTRQSYQINRRSFYAVRRIGGGYEQLKRFCYLMNLPPPLSENAYRKTNKTFNTKIKNVSEKIMSEAVDEVRTNSQDQVSNVGISVDGTWQKRGFTSINGTVIAISLDSGKVVDADVMARFCQICVNNKNNNIQKVHQCMLNHAGSAPMMEQAGVVRIFGRSEAKYNVRYTEYLGDGDTKSFGAVKDTYGPNSVIKKECVGHVQKRVGKRLRDLKKKEKGLGKLGLNDLTIDRLQNFYGIAIRSNVGNIAGMKENIYAALMHVSSNANNNYHWRYCPTGPESWCKYQRDLANNTQLYKPGKGLQNQVLLHVKKVFLDLSKDELLSRCLHGKTQNCNESFNGMVWNRIPKERFVKLKTFEIGVHDSIIHFNVGALATLLVYDEVGVERGYWTIKGCESENRMRLNTSLRKTTESAKTQRRKLRGRKKGIIDKNREKEGKVYGSGIAE